MILEKHERKRFADYCRQQVESCELMAEQMVKLLIVGDELARRERAKAAAYAIVLADLESIEDFCA